MRLTLVALLLIALAGCGKPEGKPRQGEQSQTAEASAGSIKGIDRSGKGTPAPEVTFTDPDGGEIEMADLKGAPVLINLWATWCAPCVKELPTLDRLAQRFDKDGDFAVVPVSQDNAPQASVTAFLAKLNVPRLGAYHDPKMRLSGALGAQVLPTSILYDAEGREVWRYVGDFDWAGAEAAKLLAEGGVPARP